MAIWNGIRDGLGSVLAFFYSIVPNSGVAIILLTVAVRLVLFPLTAKQAKSMLAMQRVQPEIKKLQAKFKNDRQKLNEEMMKFYKENEINPLGGCLPLVLQMPIFIALFQTLRKIQEHIPTSSKMYTDICGAHTQPSACKPHMSFLGMNLTTPASKAVSSGIGNAAPYLILVALVLVTGYLQQRQTMRNQTTPNPQMAIISKIFPIVFGFISWGIPSGVVLYFFTSNLWQIGQQEVVLRTIGSAAGPPKKKGAQALDEGSSGGSTKTVVVDDSSKPKKPAAGGAKPKTAPGKTTGGSNGAAKSKPTGNGQARGSDGARSNRKRKR